MNTELQTTWIVLKQTLLRSRKTLMWWTIGVALYTLINIAIYPSFKDSILLETQNYPQGLVEAFGLNNLGELGPYIYAQVFLMLPLILAFLPVTSFAGAIAGAEERGALDVLLTQPLKRRTLVIATWTAAVVSVATVLLVTGVLSWLTVQLIGENMSIADLALASWSVFPVTIAVGSLGLLFSAAMRNRGAVLGISIATLFLLYLIDVIGKIDSSLDSIRYISPFRYFGDVFSVTIPVWYYLLLLAMSAILLVISIAVFERRDIYT